MTVNFELDGQQFVALNGGPDFTFNEALSLQVSCTDQDEVDKFWRSLPGRRGGSLRLAEGQVRPVLADRPDRSAGVPQRPGPGEDTAGQAGHAGMKKIGIDGLRKAADAA